MKLKKILIFKILVYFDIGEGEFNQGVLEFNFDTSASAVGRSFEIKVTQINASLRIGKYAFKKSYF